MRSKPSGRWLVKSLRCARGREFGLAAAAVGGPLVALLVVPLGAAALEPAPGVTLEAGVIADSYANVRGGADPDGSFHTLGAFSLGLTLDLEALAGWRGAALYAAAQSSRGRTVTERELGSLQYVSSYEAPEMTQLGEVWLEQTLAGGKLRLKAGKQDANTDFCAPEFGATFVNCSFYLAPNVPITAYPDPGLGVAAFARARPWLEVGAGVYDGAALGSGTGFDTAFDGQGGGFQVLEARVRPGGPDSGPEDGILRLGLWRHTGDVLEITDAAQFYVYTQNHGLYLLLDGALWRERPAGGSSAGDESTVAGAEEVAAAGEEGEAFQGLGAFLQYGWAPGDRNEIRQYFGAGLLWQGALPGRDGDALGAGVASARLCRQLSWLEGLTGETAWELFYRAQVTPWLAVQPDLQYFVHPGGGGKDNALAAGLRVEMSL